MAKNEKTLPVKIVDKAQSQLISDIAQDIVNQMAPQEKPLFRSINDAYFKDPEKTLRGKTGGDEMLGFGMGAAVTFLTPIALAVTTEVVMFVAGEVKKTIKEESSGLVNDHVKKLFKKFRSPGHEGMELPRLSAKQLGMVRQKAIEKARLLNLPEAQAKLLAESLVGSLACEAA